MSLRVGKTVVVRVWRAPSTQDGRETLRPKVHDVMVIELPKPYNEQYFFEQSATVTRVEYSDMLINELIPSSSTKQNKKGGAWKALLCLVRREWKL